MRLARWLTVLASLTCPLWSPSAALAQWAPDGVVVCDDPSAQAWPHAVTDGSGGAFVLWQDRRSSTPDALYLQHLTASGTIAAGWPVNGEPIITAHYLNWLTVISDGQGGVLVGFADSRDLNFVTGVDAYCIRILGDGSVAPGWIPSGTPVCTAPTDQFGPSIVSDGSGGVLAVWSDKRNGTANEMIYGQHLTSDGSIASGWERDGVIIDDTPNSGGGGKYNPIPVADGAGGMIVIWSDTRHYALTGLDIYAQRISGAGEFFDTWRSIGDPICTLPGLQHAEAAVPDGAGGAFVTWVDAGMDPNLFQYDIYLSRIRGNSRVATGWPTNGLVLSDAPGTQQAPYLAVDGLGGVIVAWDDRGPGGTGAHATRVLANGSIPSGWVANGNPVVLPPGVDPRIAGDGAGGAFVLLTTYRDNHPSEYIMRLGPDGGPSPGWPGAGRLVENNPTGWDGDRSLAPDASGGAFVVWNRLEGNGNIYAQHFPHDLPVAALPSLTSASAEPGIAMLAWFVSGGLDPGSSVERQDAGADWVPVGAPTDDGVGHLTFEDRGVPAGHHGYRLRYRLNGTEGVTDAAWVDVPATAGLSLAGFLPNPARGALPVSFSLPNGEPARLELFTIGGRRVAAREVGSSGAGTHVLPMQPAEALPGGVYWLRLTQGARSLTTKGIVLGR